MGSIFLQSELTPVLGAVVTRHEGCETVIFVTVQVWQNQKVGLSSPYLQTPCAQHNPGACGKKQCLVSVFCCNFSIYQWAQRSSIIITRAQKHSPGSGNNLFIHHYKQTQGVIWYDLFSNKFEMFKIDLCFSYLFWWYFHKIKKTTISSAQRRSTLLLGDRTSVSSLDSAIADCQKWRLCGQLKASAYTQGTAVLCEFTLLKPMSLSSCAS